MALKLPNRILRNFANSRIFSGNKQIGATKLKFELKAQLKQTLSTQQVTEEAIKIKSGL